jgi:DNA invertase Pin-like site-specific DNA recombinase
MEHVLGAFAEFERLLIVERTQAGLKAAKHRGQKLGRKPSLSDAQREHARALTAKGESPAAVAKLLNVCRATLDNSLKE